MAHPLDVHGREALATPSAHHLDNAVWAALAGPHARFAERVGLAARCPADVYAFAALADPADPAAWADLHALFGPSTNIRIKGVDSVPEGWEILGKGQGVQLVDTALRSEPAPETVRLGRGDVPEILDLGRLIAMAGERLRLPGWTEISAVCTDPAYRGRGLATRLVRAVAAGIRERGETPLTHAAATNTGAIRLYESIGFTLRRRTTILQVRTPGTGGEARP